MEDETREEYLEAVYKLMIEGREDKVKTGKLAKVLSVSPPTVTEVLPLLEKEGFIEYEPYYGVSLTPKGEELGREIVRKHRVLEVFLNRYFTIERNEIHEKACQMEHIFNMKMINEMCKNLGAPERCPHGKIIPPCDEDYCPIEGDED